MEEYIAKAPLFRDPVYDGAADPVVIFNRETEEWWMFYTNRRAILAGPLYSYVHGTDIGIAVSKDGGKSWLYRGIAEGLEFEWGRNTFWAPEVIYADGKYHMYCTYVRGVPYEWGEPSYIVHYTSDNLYSWKFEAILDLSDNPVIDACVRQLPDGRWKMWFKEDAHTYTAYSDDLYNWTRGGAEVLGRGHEGPNVFTFKGHNWLIADCWAGQMVFKSDTFDNWQFMNIILDEPGKRPDDGFIGGHAHVVVCGERAYIFYFVHPERTAENCKQAWIHEDYHMKRSSIQVAELIFNGETLVCDRDAAVPMLLIGEGQKY